MEGGISAYVLSENAEQGQNRPKSRSVNTAYTECGTVTEFLSDVCRRHKVEYESDDRAPCSL